MAAEHDIGKDDQAGHPLAWVDPVAAAREAQALLEDLFADPLPVQPAAGSPQGGHYIGSIKCRACCRS